jgi:hypothetical protein
VNALTKGYGLSIHARRCINEALVHTLRADPPPSQALDRPPIDLVAQACSTSTDSRPFWFRGALGRVGGLVVTAVAIRAMIGQSRAVHHPTRRSDQTGLGANAVSEQPIRRILSGCWARGITGHAAVAPPSNVMDARRFTARCLPCCQPKGCTSVRQETAALRLFNPALCRRWV